MSLKNLSVKNKIPKILIEKLDNKKVNLLYKKFEKSFNLDENFIVAVSGGSDSLALAYLSKIYATINNLRSEYFIIDHRIRSESTSEAKLVKNLLKKFHIKAEILTWLGKKPMNNIQSVARNKRYELLFKKCKKNKIKNILIGHHQDDLFENFFIRFLRGSGLRGLVSLDKKTKIFGINLYRPLLNFKKDDLIFLSKYIFNFYVDDPSNRDEKYQRIKVRKLIKGLNGKGLDKSKLYKSIINLKDSNETIKFYVRQNLINNTYYSLKKNKLILNKEFFSQPHEVVFRALSDSIKLVGKKYYLSRGKKIDKIITQIQNDAFFKGTLGGCIIEKVNQTLIITKET